MFARKKLVEVVEILFYVKIRWIAVEKSKMSQEIGGQDDHLGFSIGPKNINFVEEFEILLPVKFRRMPFSGWREDVEKVLANQRPGLPSWFYDRPRKLKLGRGL